MNATAEQAAAVDRGEALMNERDPGWQDEIDVDALDLTTTDMCVLGQRCPDMALAEYLGVEDPERLLDGSRTDAYWVNASRLSGIAVGRLDTANGALTEWSREHGFTGGWAELPVLTAEWKRRILAARAAS